MELTRKNKVIISGVIVILLLSIYISFDRRSKSQGEEKLTNIEIATTTDSTSQVSTKGSGNYTIERVAINEGKGVTQPIPDLNREIIVSGGAIISADANTLATSKIKALQTQLKTNSADLPAWLDLGMYQKMAGDYQGAILSWKYASKLAPTDYISLANLGNLYAYFLKDNGQAEVYYKEAIVKGPTQAYLYMQLAEIYRDIFKDIDKARITINQGLSKIPNDPTLIQFLSNLN